MDHEIQSLADNQNVTPKNRGLQGHLWFFITCDLLKSKISRIYSQKVLQLESSLREIASPIMQSVVTISTTYGQYSELSTYYQKFYCANNSISCFFSVETTKLWELKGVRIVKFKWKNSSERKNIFLKTKILDGPRLGLQVPQLRDKAEKLR